MKHILRIPVIVILTISSIIYLTSCDEEPFVPTVSTSNVTAITQTTASSGGNVTDDGGGAIIERGTCWATTSNPTITNDKTIDGTGSGSFTSNLSGLLSGTTYYVRAYATNSAGTAYGNEVSFTTELECALVCNIGTESYSIEITCESGSTTTEYNNESTEYQYDSYGKLSGLKLNLNQSRTYENTQNTYQIVGVINVNLTQNTVTHNITVTGGVFNDPQTCN